ncbi:hypothetical protein JCM6882_001206 [Rhodosporidiobolus microsporus]
MPLDLPLKLQHYILELALPSTKLFTGPERRRLLRTFSLVHSSWTPVAQRLLFQQVVVKIITHVSPQRPINALAELMLNKVTPITRFEVDATNCSRDDWTFLQHLWKRFPDLSNLIVYFSRFVRLPLAGDWPKSVVSFMLATKGAKPSNAAYLELVLPASLTRLVLSTIQTRSYLPPLPNLETLILTRTTVLPSGLKCDVLFPSLCVFAWDNVSSPPSLFVFPTFPPATKHMRLNLTKEWPLSDALELMDDLPIGLSSLDIHLVPLTLKALPEAVKGRLSWTETTRMRFTTSDEMQEDIELWEARL